LAYIIVKFKTFNIKVIATEALIWALWILIGSILFVAQTPATKVVTAITEVIAVVFGFILLNSVRREVEQREKLEVLSNELKSANDRLEILDQQKTQFVSFASHDLKSPINIIKQFASLIADGTYKEPAKVAETVLKIKSTADRATQMVDDFLDIRKIEEGKMDYNFEKKDIVSFVKGICEDYAPVAKAQKNIVISFIPATSKSPAGSIMINMDSTRLRQVFQNYLNNSVKYSNANNPGENKSWIKVMVTEEQSTVLITIKDSGMGINPEILPTLFEQFHRDKKTVKKIQGTGLGLYISKQIVHGHGGETWAESEGVDKGSIFYVRLKKA
jgi:signal transduction histidine kinase